MINYICSGNHTVYQFEWQSRVVMSSNRTRQTCHDDCDSMDVVENWKIRDSNVSRINASTILNAMIICIDKERESGKKTEQHIAK